MVWVLSHNHAMSSEAVLRKVPFLVLGVPKPICCILRAFATLQNFIVHLETNERSAFTIFSYSNHHAHVLDCNCRNILEVAEEFGQGNF